MPSPDVTPGAPRELPVSVRSGRTDRRAVLAVTGADAGLGRALLERLADAPHPAAVVGLGAGPGRRTDVDWRPAGVRDPDLVEQLAGVDTVVHLEVDWDVTGSAALRRDLTVRGTARLLDAARRAGVARVVLTTSTDVYGSAPRVLLDADPLTGAADDHALVGDHVEVERLAAHAARSGVAVTVLRPATLVGGRLGPAYDGPLLRQLGGPRLLAVRGVEPQWQLCHVDDLLGALELAATGVVTGGRAVACAGAMPQSIVEAIAGRRRLELPASVALSTAERLRRAGVTTSSPRELDHLLGPLVVTCDGLRDAGWLPAWTNETALRAHLAERGGDARAAGVAAAGATAAGATAALIGTAALVRRARRRRGR